MTGFGTQGSSSFMNSNNLAIDALHLANENSRQDLARRQTDYPMVPSNQRFLKFK
jgi:hypothetical protein